MIKDYKSQYAYGDLDGHKRHPKLVLFALFFLALAATAVYASFQILDSQQDAAQTANTLVLAPANAAEPAPVPASETPIKQKRIVSLPLPGLKHTPEERKESIPQPANPTTLETNQPITSAKIAEEAPVADSTEPVDATEQAAAPVSTTKESATNESVNDQATSTEVVDASDEANHNWVEEKVRSGDSLARIFSRLNLSSTLLHNIVNSSKEAKELANIKPGQIFKIRLDSDGSLRELIHQRSKINSLQITAAGDSYKAKTINRNLETRTAEISGVITNSLFQSAQEAGLSDDLIMDLAYIFGWDIDFALEIRNGDRFSVVYEEQYLDGEKYRNGAILAAEFINRGNPHRAIRYEDEEGYANYFSPDGKSMRKAFLRAPVDFRRISSRFTTARWHPVLGKKRPHRGVDYAAKTGTPIKASGDGKIIHLGRKGGYGKTIIIKHANRYTTLYAHMNGYKRGLKKGSRVKQGQVIGYVGSTGMSTGPHLHYEFRVNGVHRNPLTVKLPAALPIEKKYRNDFMKKSKPLLARLDSISSTMVAEAKTDP
ncbi:MAG: peptidoglycan DD-metalloendopeptidase family protein [Chromatiales bacterium]|nr:peptidoglycan DD-metalloendopeptidase family protein [Chromatiales bacterium]